MRVKLSWSGKETRRHWDVKLARENGWEARRGIFGRIITIKLISARGEDE